MTLKAENISVRLKSALVLSGVSASLSPGELVAVVGPNGAGKSTLLRTMAGLVPTGHGSVLLDGKPLGGFEPKALAKRIAYLPQERTVHWDLTAWHVASLGRLPYRGVSGAGSPEGIAAVQRAMERMDVAQFAARPVSTLSGGERARVLVARALAQEAAYLIADEPAAGLDPAHSLSLFAELQRLAREGHAILTALHDLSLALRFATRIIVLKRGACLFDGLPAESLSTQNIAEAFGIEAIVSEIAGFPVVLPHTPLGIRIPVT
jgi:iron complex transport system ATP-binding protein